MMAEDLWTIDEVAQYLGVASVTVRAYLARDKMPPPDQKYGVTNLWKPETIKTWHESRPYASKDDTDSGSHGTTDRA